MRMLISSFYNTLINKEEAISFSTMLEIDKLRKKDILFSICTSRSHEEVLYYNHDYPFIDYIISYNGNCIYDVKKKKNIYKNPLKKTLIKKVEEIFKDKKIIYYKDNKDIYKLEIKIKRKELDLINELENLNIYTSIFILNKDYYIEITNNNTYEGINALKTKLKIDNNDIITVIGNLAEKEIIANIKKTYVVSNAPKELKEKANYKTKSNNLKGVEQVIKKEAKIN